MPLTFSTTASAEAEASDHLDDLDADGEPDA